MTDEYPQIIKEVGFDFHWDEGRVWALDVPVTEMAIRELEWHFDIPFWDKGGRRYALKPRDVIEHPEEHKEEYDRTMAADLSYPLDIMENKGRWLMLDGLHRLVKAVILGEKKVRVRIVPRERIPDIAK